MSKGPGAAADGGRPPLFKQHEKEFLAGLTPERREWLDRRIGPEGPELLPDLLALSRRDLLRLFPGQPADPEEPGGPPRATLNDTAVIMALAWQLAMKIGAGVLEPLHGNMRTAWYRYVEPFYLEKDLLDSDVGLAIDVMKLLLPEDVQGALEEAAREARTLGLLKPLRLWAAGSRRAGALNRAARERYITNVMAEAFGALYLAGILDFEDHFGFEDPGEAIYHIGRRKAGRLLFTEKLGLRKLAERMGQRHGISWFVSHGEPSLMALAFMAKKLKQRVKLVKVGAVTDYDPFGYSIASSAGEKLAGEPLFGAGRVELVRLTGSQAMLRRLFTPADLQRAKRDLKRYHRFKQKQIAEWMAVTGGVDGEAFGVHIDLADMARMEKLIEEWIDGAV